MIYSVLNHAREMIDVTFDHLTFIIGRAKSVIQKLLLNGFNRLATGFHLKQGLHAIEARRRTHFSFLVSRKGHGASGNLNGVRERFETDSRCLCAPLTAERKQVQGGSSGSAPLF